MSLSKLLCASAIAVFCADTAMAQSYVRTYESVPTAETEIVRAQFIRPGDVSPEEYQRLIEEADRIQAYQGTADYSNYSTYSSSTYSAPATTTSTYIAPTTTTYSYDGRPSVTESNSAGYQIELYDTPVTAPVTYSSSTTTFSPASSTISASHTVVRGDTLYSISKRFGVKVSDLKSANNLYGNTISIGQILMLPIRRQQVSENTYISPSVTSSSGQTTLVRNVEPVPFSGVYAVLPGDTLYSIARRACVSVTEITENNSIRGNTTIHPGQRLTMPTGHCLQ